MLITVAFLCRILTELPIYESLTNHSYIKFLQYYLSYRITFFPYFVNHFVLTTEPLYPRFFTVYRNSIFSSTLPVYSLFNHNLRSNHFFKSYYFRIKSIFAFSKHRFLTSCLQRLFPNHTILTQNPIISSQNPSISPQNRFLHNFSNIYIQITFCLFHVLYFSYGIYNLITFVLCHF